MKISAPGSGSSQRPWLRPAPATLPERYFFIAALNLILFSYDLVPCGSLFQLSDTQTLKLIKLYFLISSLARGICKLQSPGVCCAARSYAFSRLRFLKQFTLRVYSISVPCTVLNAVLRSRHFFGRLRLRLRMANVPEPTPAPAPTYLGRLRLQAKKGGSGSIH